MSTMSGRRSHPHRTHIRGIHTSCPFRLTIQSLDRTLLREMPPFDGWQRIRLAPSKKESALGSALIEPGPESIQEVLFPNAIITAPTLPHPTQGCDGVLSGLGATKPLAA